MTYHEERVLGKGKFHYIVKAVRINGRVKKFRVYAGKGNKTEKEIQELVNKFSAHLDSKAMAYLAKKDPLFGMLSEGEVSALTEIRNRNLEKQKGMDRLMWQNYYEWFLTEFTYDTNAIEGSTLSLRDTGLILFDNVVPEGKSPREINEVQNHKQAFDYILDFRGNLTQKFILEIHKKLMHNILWKHAGKIRDVNVYIRGVDIVPPPHFRVRDELKNLMEWHKKNCRKYHPVILAAYFHAAFESVHPFRDGNGRTGRLILNFMLRKEGYPMINVKNKEKSRYYKSLYAAQKNHDLKPLLEMIIDYLREASKD